MTPPEAPWPDGPMDATLDWTWGDRQENDHWAGLGALWFLSPETEGWHAGHKCFVIVSKTTTEEGEVVGGQNVWHIKQATDGPFVMVSPSVHFVGHFHSPRPVEFRLVEKLAEDTASRP